LQARLEISAVRAADGDGAYLPASNKDARQLPPEPASDPANSGSPAPICRASIDRTQPEMDMNDSPAGQPGPDLAGGVPTDALADGKMLLGHVGEDAVLLARSGGEYFAIASECTHYHGALVDGLVVGETVRCPLHHACFSLRTGEAVRAPAFDPVACWSVAVRGNQVFVLDKVETAPRTATVAAGEGPHKVVIVGGGAAGFAAAEMLRRQHYEGSIVMLSEDDAPPVDRPNLSKDYLDGSAPEDWLWLRPQDDDAERRVDLRLATRVVAIDTRARELELGDGSKIGYDRLLLATGAEPVRLTIPGMDLPHVHTLRSLADTRAIIASAGTARSAVVMGASFIGLEVAASLRKRGLEVHVVAPDKRPMERVLGPAMGDFVRSLHEAHGVVFHLEDAATAIEAHQVTLGGGSTIAADLVVVGVGVRPRLALAEKAGLAVDRGVVVDARLETSVPGVYAAGDIARWPDPHSGESMRVEHWVVAQRQGQAAALNMLGGQVKFDAVPFFWSQHYDVAINYAGHAQAWDELTIDGDIEGRDCALRYKLKGRLLAIATINRDAENLMAEEAMEGEAT
jgi:NADPH-dependent 2,4-dienoyl-CoA reductase/sulfur reductase-like enzyme/nitrite reductase/ring-hydroxylating ferredoxin subunit